MTGPLMIRLRVLSVVLAGLAAASVGSGCDRKWDFECTAVWEARDGTELSRKVHNYGQMDSEQAATEKCKEEIEPGLLSSGRDARRKGLSERISWFSPHPGS